MKMKWFGIFSLVLALATGFPEKGAHAEEPGSYTATYRNSILNPGSITPFDRNAYSLRGTSVALDYLLSESLPTAVSGSGKVNLECIGGAGNGGWTFSIQPGSMCWNAFSFPCPGPGCGTQVPAHPITAADIKITPRSLCTGTTRGTPAEKQYCVFGTGVTGDTSDDMFSLAPGASAYLEYMRRGGIDTPQRLKYISRAGATGRSLMIPTGPLGSFADYDAFLSAPPAGAGVTVRDACYAMNVTVCEDARPQIPVGECGIASGRSGDETYRQYFLAAASIPATGLCSSGMPSSIQDRGGYFTWRCSNGTGYESSECSAGKAVEPACGPAHEQTYSSREQIADAALCAQGTPSEVTGTGPWNWTCNPGTPGATPKSCTALRYNDGCESNVGDVVYILDDSNSMRSNSKLARARSTMQRSFELLVEKKSRQMPDDAKICITGMQNRAFVNYVQVRGCPQLRAYAKKSCGVPVSAGGNEQELSDAAKSNLCANYWGGAFYSAADPDPAVKAQILAKGTAAISSFTDTELSTPLYRRVMQAARYVGSGDPGKPNKIIVITDGNDVGWESDNDALNVLRSYSNIRVYILHIVNRSSQVDDKPKKNVVSITNATNGFYARVVSEDTNAFQGLMNKAVMGCEIPSLP